MQLTKNQQLIAYLGEKHTRATITVLIKLAYFIDLVAMKKTGKQISNFSYVRYFYGPFDQKIYGDIEVLIENNIFGAELSYTSTGEEYAVYTSLGDGVELLDITSNEKEIIDGVLESVNGYGAKTLTQMAYKTRPMVVLGATLGGKENMKSILDLKA